MLAFNPLKYPTNMLPYSKQEFFKGIQWKKHHRNQT